MTAETGWTSRVGVLDEAYAVMIGRVDGPGIVRFQSNLARRELPHCSAIGKALLSHLPEARVRGSSARPGLPARTAHDDHDVPSTCSGSSRAYADEAVRGRRRGGQRGCRLCRLSVYDHRDHCVAAISLTGLKLSPPSRGIDGLGQVVRYATHAKTISGRLGAVI